MKNKLWKRINKRIRIVGDNDKFIVEIRDNYHPTWRKLREFKIHKEALCQKHHYIRIILYKDLGVGLRYKKKSYAK